MGSEHLIVNSPRSSLEFYREAGSWLPYSPIFPVFCLSLQFRIRRFFQKLVQHTKSFPSHWSFSYHPTLYHLRQKAFASEYKTNPILFRSSDHIHKTSFFLYHLQYLFICFHVSTADLFHLSPHPHLKSLQSTDIFFPICPCFSCIESYTPYYSFNDSLLVAR